MTVDDVTNLGGAWNHWFCLPLPCDGVQRLVSNLQLGQSIQGYDTEEYNMSHETKFDRAYSNYDKAKNYNHKPTQRLHCISNLHTGIFGLIPLCPCDNCCIVYYGPTALLLGLK